jgi:hypothetical protein
VEVEVEVDDGENGEGSGVIGAGSVWAQKAETPEQLREAQAGFLPLTGMKVL